MIIAIDFDGTCVKDKFPEVGENIGAEQILKELIDNGHKLILYTIRSGKYLDEALKWFRQNNIELYGVNHNRQQWKFSSSPKVYADMYIDDLALGCPLKYDIDNNKFVDWNKVSELLKYIGII